MCSDYKAESEDDSLKDSLENAWQEGHMDLLGGPCSQAKIIGPCSQCQVMDFTQTIGVSAFGYSTSMKQTVHIELCVSNVNNEDGCYGVDSEDGQKVQKTTKNIAQEFRGTGYNVHATLTHFETCLCGTTELCPQQDTLPAHIEPIFCHHCLDFSIRTNNRYLKSELAKTLDNMYDESYVPKCTSPKKIMCRGQCTFTEIDATMKAGGYKVDMTVTEKSCTVISGIQDGCHMESNSENPIVINIKSMLSSVMRYITRLDIDVCVCSGPEECNENQADMQKIDVVRHDDHANAVENRDTDNNNGENTTDSAAVVLNHNTRVKSAATAPAGNMAAVCSLYLLCLYFGL